MRKEGSGGALLGVLGFFSVVLLGLSCFGGGSGNRRSINLATDLDEIDTRLHATVAFVEPETERIFCSGFFISGRLMISAAHCFESVLSVSMPDGSILNIPSGVSAEGSIVDFIAMEDLDMATNHFLNPPRQATIVYHNHQQDFVILELNAPAADSAYMFEMAAESPRVGAAAFGIGHPVRLAWSFETGIISRVIRDPSSHEVMILQTSVPVAGGNSGGPLLNAQGELIGMALAYVERLPHLSIFISVEQIRIHMRMHIVRQIIMAHELQIQRSQRQNRHQRTDRAIERFSEDAGNP